MPVFDFKDASFKGDPKWANARPPFTSNAPLLVLNLAILSIIEIILGVVHIVSISSNLSFVQVLQPLIVPGLSFFNTIPSLHLHVLARSNTPLLAMVFSSILCVIYFASAVIFLPPCINGIATKSSGGYATAECPPGTRTGVWAAMIALQFISAVGYAVHFAMAWTVRRTIKEEERGVADGTIMVVIDEAEKARREEEARRRWRDIRDL